MILNKKPILLCMMVFLSFIASSQGKNILERFQIKGYGAVNYYNFDWETDKKKRNAVDLERLNLYLIYNFTDKIQLKSEIEFEHGGTGSTMEFDKFEEFGEFEAEIEAGGAVLLEQLNVLFKYKSWLNIRAGGIKLYIGMAAKLDEATTYFTGYRSSIENAILPLGWYETGIELLGDFGKSKKWSYKLYLVNGLSSTGFSSANWIKRGHQKRFETKNAENLAGAFRLDYKLPRKSWIGISGYHGNTIENRQKPDLDGVDGAVSLFDFHVNLNYENWIYRGMFLYGHLQNSDIITTANKNLSNNLNVKRTPVGESALGWYAEAGYNFLSLISEKTKSKIYVFGRYEFYDTMYKTAPGVFKNERWKRNMTTFGFNYFPHKDIVIKSHFSYRVLGTNETEKTFLLGLGFKFNSKNKKDEKK